MRQETLKSSTSKHPRNRVHAIELYAEPPFIFSCFLEIKKFGKVSWTDFFFYNMKNGWDTQEFAWVLQHLFGEAAKQKFFGLVVFLYCMFCNQASDLQSWAAAPNANQRYGP